MNFHCLVFAKLERNMQGLLCIGLYADVVVQLVYLNKWAEICGSNKFNLTYNVNRLKANRQFFTILTFTSASWAVSADHHYNLVCSLGFLSIYALNLTDPNSSSNVFPSTGNFPQRKDFSRTVPWPGFTLILALLQRLCQH